MIVANVRLITMRMLGCARDAGGRQMDPNAKEIYID